MLWTEERLRARKSVSEVIHCRCLASPRGAIDLIDQKEDQEVEDGDGIKLKISVMYGLWPSLLII